MQITKLTLTPLAKGWPQAVIDYPSTSSARQLIKERLVSGYSDNFSKPRVFRRIPKFLKGFVNPSTKITENNKFFATV